MTVRQMPVLVCDHCPDDSPQTVFDGVDSQHINTSAMAKHYGWETINDRAPNGEIYQIRHKCKACKE